MIVRRISQLGRISGPALLRLSSVRAAHKSASSGGDDVVSADAIERDTQGSHGWRRTRSKNIDRVHRWESETMDTFQDLARPYTESVDFDELKSRLDELTKDPEWTTVPPKRGFKDLFDLPSHRTDEEVPEIIQELEKREQTETEKEFFEELRSGAPIPADGISKERAEELQAKLTSEHSNFRSDPEYPAYHVLPETMHELPLMNDVQMERFNEPAMDTLIRKSRFSLFPEIDDDGKTVPSISDERYAAAQSSGEISMEWERIGGSIQRPFLFTGDEDQERFVAELKEFQKLSDEVVIKIEEYPSGVGVDVSSIPAATRVEKVYDLIRFPEYLDEFTRRKYFTLFDSLLERAMESTKETPFHGMENEMTDGEIDEMLKGDNDASISEEIERLKSLRRKLAKAIRKTSSGSPPTPEEMADIEKEIKREHDEASSKREGFPTR